MKAALKIVAFHGGSELSGIIALSELLIEALSTAGHELSAFHAQMAYDTYILSAAEAAEREMLGIPEMG